MPKPQKLFALAYRTSLRCLVTPPQPLCTGSLSVTKDKLSYSSLLFGQPLPTCLFKEGPNTTTASQAFPDAAGPAGLCWWHSEPSGWERCLVLWRPGGGGTEGGWPLCHSAPRLATGTSKRQRVPTSCSLWPCTCLWQGSKPVLSVGPGDMGHCIPSLLLSHFPLLDFPPC